MSASNFRTELYQRCSWISSQFSLKFSKNNGPFENGPNFEGILGIPFTFRHLFLLVPSPVDLPSPRQYARLWLHCLVLASPTRPGKTGKTGDAEQNKSKAKLPFNYKMKTFQQNDVENKGKKVNRVKLYMYIYIYNSTIVNDSMFFSCVFSSLS